MESLFIVSLSKQVKALVSPLKADTHISETEVERLIRKMLLKLISTTLPITLNPFSQFLVSNISFQGDGGEDREALRYVMGFFSCDSLF